VYILLDLNGAEMRSCDHLMDQVLNQVLLHSAGLFRVHQRLGSYAANSE
jgi:hypothetical protein